MKKWGIILGSIIIIIVAVCVGVILYNETNKPQNVINNVDTNKKIIVNEIDYSIKNDITINTNTSEEKISPNATLTLKRKFKECGHIIKEYKEITDEMINLNR